MSRPITRGTSVWLPVFEPVVLGKVTVLRGWEHGVVTSDGLHERLVLDGVKLNRIVVHKDNHDGWSGLDIYVRTDDEHAAQSLAK